MNFRMKPAAASKFLRPTRLKREGRRNPAPKKIDGDWGEGAGAWGSLHNLTT